MGANPTLGRKAKRSLAGLGGVKLNRPAASAAAVARRDSSPPGEESARRVAFGRGVPLAERT
jgi:hypothetical protein